MNVRVLVLTISFLVVSFGGNSLRGAEESSPAAANAKQIEVACHCAGAATPAMANITRILAEPLKSQGLDFTEEPLENVVNFLQAEYGFPIQLDERALEDAGITRDEPTTVQIQNVSLRSALRLLLKQKQLTYALRNEAMIITTPDEAESELVTCVYDVRELVDAMGGEREIERLANVIVSCIAPETWAANKGGEAQARTLRPGLLVISQTQAVHEEVAELLAAIRATLRQSIHPPVGGGRGMMDGSGGYGMSEGGMGEMEGGGRGGYGGQGGMEGGYGGGGGGEMGGQPESTPTEDQFQ